MHVCICVQEVIYEYQLCGTVRPCMYIYMHCCMYTSLYVCMHATIYTHIYIYLYMYSRCMMCFIAHVLQWAGFCSRVPMHAPDSCTKCSYPLLGNWVCLTPQPSNTAQARNDVAPFVCLMYMHACAQIFRHVYIPTNTYA